ncbi:hypothetical protein [Candidatus Ichthyocystis sparus]|uniref:hypothetical protein n=1 Tax=Candidatus Ichthyocystis sparus TaxID=1561004 RepID=UPI000B86C77A|nr:hypothetical protein [Candidatus Ichthyocystis sparus]
MEINQFLLTLIGESSTSDSSSYSYFSGPKKLFVIHGSFSGATLEVPMGSGIEAERTFLFGIYEVVVIVV